MSENLPVKLPASRSREIEEVAAQQGLTREGAVDWLLECALYNYNHGSLPPPRATHKAKARKEGRG